MDDFRLVASWVAEAMGGTLTGDGAREFSGVSIDTRTLEAGELFIAIRGERFDGAAFVDAAMAAGAAGVVVPRGTRVTQGREAGSASLSGERLTVIEVDDTTIALQALARAIRRESGAKVVAITGSAGYSYRPGAANWKAAATGSSRATVSIPPIAANATISGPPRTRRLNKPATAMSAIKEPNATNPAAKGRAPRGSPLQKLKTKNARSKGT